MYEVHVCDSVQRSRLTEHTSFDRHGLGLHGVVTSLCRYRYRLATVGRHTTPREQTALVTYCHYRAIFNDSITIFYR